MHRDFDAARRAYDTDWEPVEFLLGGERFVVSPDPSLGDTFDLHDAPEPTPTNEAQVSAVLRRFIRRMLAVDDRQRFDDVLYRIPTSHGPVLLDIADYVCQAATTRPTVPPATSSRGRRTTGKTSRPRAAGPARSS